ncbi:protein FAM76B isoform X2 [Parasteatoda tepidariorum]|uniref:protein FAM76B isoform X2 n=1 Tax=Parasteatoda tepidariorum TaxID=114398 RepID=UPI0039BC2EBC
MAATALFACTKCNSRHPFEELSQGQQLCKPSACEYCNIIAAFIGNKCQRCTNSEKRYGNPVNCDQCKQKCAFDRKDDSRKKVDGKLLCWLCTLSYKRALAKTKQNAARHSAHGKSSSSHHRSSSSQNHRRSSSHSSKSKKEHSPSKKPRLDLAKSANGTLPTSESTLLESSTSDHVVAMHQLKDEIATLQKKLALKDAEMLHREKQAAEVKAQHGIIERELRLKIQSMQKQHGDLVEDLQSKVRVLQKQVITLGNKNKKGRDTDSPNRL